MPSPTKPIPATCPECKRPEQILYACKYHSEAKTCSRCAAKFTARTKAAEKAGQQGATKAHDAAPAKSAAPTRPRLRSPSHGPRRPQAPPVKSPPAVVPQGRAVTLVLTVFSVAALRQVLALTESLQGVSVGLEG